MFGLTIFGGFTLMNLALADVFAARLFSNDFTCTSTHWILLVVGGMISIITRLTHCIANLLYVYYEETRIENPGAVVTYLGEQIGVTSVIVLFSKYICKNSYMDVLLYIVGMSFYLYIIWLSHADICLGTALNQSFILLEIINNVGYIFFTFSKAPFEKEDF